MLAPGRLTPGSCSRRSIRSNAPRLGYAGCYAYTDAGGQPHMIEWENAVALPTPDSGWTTSHVITDLIYEGGGNPERSVTCLIDDAGLSIWSDGGQSFTPWN